VKIRGETRALIATAVLIAAGAVAAATLSARADTRGRTWNIAIGGETPDHGVQANIFAPGTMTIHAGDTVTWTMRALYAHTVTFLSGSPPPPLAVPQKDGRLLLAPEIAFPRGGPAYSGRGVASSGVLDGKDKRYTLTFTTPGRYSYLCLLHPGQAGTVVVLPPGRRLPHTQAEYDRQAGAEAARALQQGSAARASARVTATRRGTRMMYTVPLVGAAGGRAAVDRFLPESLSVRAGDTVRWVMQDPSELHTVTFTGPAAPPEFLVQAPQAQGPPRIYFNPKVAAPTRGSIHAGDAYYNSGFMTAGAPGTVRSYQLTFATPGTYTYWCVVHVPQGMKGTVVVR
jgi:plastocyanin